MHPVIETIATIAISATLGLAALIFTLLLSAVMTALYVIEVVKHLVTEPSHARSRNKPR